MYAAQKLLSSSDIGMVVKRDYTNGILVSDLLVKYLENIVILD